MEKRAGQLEADLLASWDRDTLAVYADYLQADGDPRGELIALDLQIEAHGNNPELSKRRTSLLFAWLGSLVPVDNVHASWAGDSMRFGFVEDLIIDGNDANMVARLEQLLESPAGPYIRGVTMTGNFYELELAASALARYDHPWLTRLSISRTSSGADQAITADLATQMFAKMPRLDSLELLPHPALSPLSHSTITKLAIRGEAVYRALGDGSKFAAVRELVLHLAPTNPYEYYDEEYDVEAPVVDAAVPKVSFPQLRRLDLSPNGEAIDAAYTFLRTFDARAHITHLKIPQLRNASERNDLISVIRDMRALEVVEVALGHYYDPPDLPKVKFVRAEVWPWPTQDLARGVGMKVYMPRAKFGDTVTVEDAVYFMETRYEKMSPSAREAWSQLWRLFATLEREQVAPFPARMLAEAVEALPELMVNGWRELREELSTRRPFAPDATVKIERGKV